MKAMSVDRTANSDPLISDTPKAVIEAALAEIAEKSGQETDGKWLEHLTVRVAPHVRDWDIAEAWRWADWPAREEHFPHSTKRDLGIDVVAVRRSDQAHIAIQCKSKQLDDDGKGQAIVMDEIRDLLLASRSQLWRERWVAIIGNTPLTIDAQSLASSGDRPVKTVNVGLDAQQQHSAFGIDEERCFHCEPQDGGDPLQTRTCMQNEAITDSIRILSEHARSESGGLPRGQARGKIILPCGTGKTRVSLRIVEELTLPGELSVVLCPSIALVAQIRREYLQHTGTQMRALAVCSDKTAGYDPKKEGSRNTAENPMLDNSNVSATEVKGKVTTDPDEIADWIRKGYNSQETSVIFGTYQSGHRVAEALRATETTARVLVCDEAHRTAGIRKKKALDQQLRDFTLCHDNDMFPATYRVYQTATPRIYDTSRVRKDHSDNFVVRTMDDETVFGVELYRRSYVDAVQNGWLSDYRIIALGVNDPEAYRQANRLARETESKGRKKLTTVDYLRGMAFVLAIGGATQGGNGDVAIRSCIAFMNTVDKSKNMAKDLQTDKVREWLRDRMQQHMNGQSPTAYTLEHLDATSNVTARDNAKRRLAEATGAGAHGVINVGIFGEGTDAPSLSAVAFLEARKSPIDVVQAVGRAMRITPEKTIGYIICPIVFPPNADPEEWLSLSSPEEGWRELGQILLALRSHDQRIEDNLADLLDLYLPKPPDSQHTLVGTVSPQSTRIHYGTHKGTPGSAQAAVGRVAEGKTTHAQEDIRPVRPEAWETDSEPTQIITGKANSDGSVELRADTVVRKKAGGQPGSLHPVDVDKSKKRAKEMVNKGAGIRVRRRRRTSKEVAEDRTAQMLRLIETEFGDSITVNLLSKSGLTPDRVTRDLNLLEGSVNEAAHHLREDGLQPALDRHFRLDNLRPTARDEQADGCVTAGLLMMNAAMLHQRIAQGRWISGIEDLSEFKNHPQVVRRIYREWQRITRQDFRPVIDPALEVIEAVEETGKVAGLERALRHIAAEAERIAVTYADMGADHAGPLFNRVMGNQASDGAYFSRPPAASIAARLALDACGDSLDWSDPETWRQHKTVDLACGSGTLLAATLTEMKRRARQQGATEEQLTYLQRLAVEGIFKGLDINAVSLQLAATQLTTGNQDIPYREMGLHKMPYGPQPNMTQVPVGTLELLEQKDLAPRLGELGYQDNRILSQAVGYQYDPDIEDALGAVKDARIVIMNPPFTSRDKMGEKFPKDIRDRLKARLNRMGEALVAADKEMEGFWDKRNLRQGFVALADRCVNQTNGIIAMISPTIVASSPTSRSERLLLAERYHIHTVVTSHQPNNINLSQKTGKNESIIVLKKHQGTTPPTRFINLDKLPVDDREAGELHHCLREHPTGILPDGWGEVFEWPAERIESGDWTPAIWRSAKLAEAAARFSNHPQLTTIADAGLTVHAMGRGLRGGGKSPYSPATIEHRGAFPLIKSKGAEGQHRIEAVPDEYWAPKQHTKAISVRKLLGKAGHLLITAGQRNNTARLTAVATAKEYIGYGWMPVAGLTPEEAKAAAVFINSTPGRLQLMRNATNTLGFPEYTKTGNSSLRLPALGDRHLRRTLADCWEQTRHMVVPLFRDGECEVRRLWDDAVCDALGWNKERLARLRNLLHREPYVRGLGYNQYGDAPDTDA